MQHPFYFLDPSFDFEGALVQDFFVYEANYLTTIPERFNACRIKLKGDLGSDLNWKNEILLAREMVKKNYFVFWELDLGLFSHLRWPLYDQTQFLALSLAVRHFRDAVYSEFKEQTAGLSLYRGTLNFYDQLAKHDDFQKGFDLWLKDHFNINSVNAPSEWTELLMQIYGREAACEFMHQLQQQLSSDLTPTLLFDIAETNDPVALAMLLSPEGQLQGFNRAVSQSPLPYEAFTPKLHGYISSKPIAQKSVPAPNMGIVLPALHDFLPNVQQALDSLMEKLNKRNLAYRFVPESFLTVQWQGLDSLIVISETINDKAIRKLHGFCAAGGIIISFGKPLRLPEETSFEVWIK